MAVLLIQHRLRLRFTAHSLHLSLLHSSFLLAPNRIIHEIQIGKKKEEKGGQEGVIQGIPSPHRPILL